MVKALGTDELSVLVRNSRDACNNPELLPESVHVRASTELAELISNVDRATHSEENRERTRLLLVLVRNLCSAGSSFAEQMLETRVLPSLAGACDSITGTIDQGRKYTDRDEAENFQLRMLRLITQLLANMSTASEPCANRIFAEFFPTRFEKISRVRLWSVTGPLCMCLTSCCRWSKDLCMRLCTQSPKTLCGLLSSWTACDVPENERFGEGEWVLMLFGRLVYCEGMLDVLYSNMQVHEEGACKVSNSQVELLHFLAISGVIEWVPETEMTAQGVYDGFCGMFSIAKKLSVILAECESTVNEGASRGLEWTFSSLKSLSCFDASVRFTDGSDVVTAVCENQGFVEWLLTALNTLDPIRTPNRVIQQMEPPSPSPAKTEEVQSLFPVLKVEDRDTHPTKSPFVGYRSDLVAVISNVVFRRQSIQDEVLRLGGVPLLLSQCQVDGGSPLVREWAVWAIRNLCEGNTRIRDLVKSLEIQGVVQTEELEKMGIRIEVDKETGKVKVGKKEYGEYFFV